MFKKLFLIFIFFLGLFSSNFLYASPAVPSDLHPDRQQELKDRENKQKIKEQNQKMVEERDKACDASNNCLDKPNFTIPVSSMFNFGGGLTSNISGSNAEEKINSTLGYVIQKLMIALGIISLFVMTIGAGYIILYHGQDDLLSKGKNIFMAGIISLVVALSSYYIVSLVRYLIFT